MRRSRVPGKRSGASLETFTDPLPSSVDWYSRIDVVESQAPSGGDGEVSGPGNLTNQIVFVSCGRTTATIGSWSETGRPWSASPETATVGIRGWICFPANQSSFMEHDPPVRFNAQLINQKHHCGTHSR